MSSRHIHSRELSVQDARGCAKEEASARTRTRVGRAFQGIGRAGVAFDDRQHRGIQRAEAVQEHRERLRVVQNPNVFFGVHAALHAGRGTRALGHAIEHGRRVFEDAQGVEFEERGGARNEDGPGAVRKCAEHLLRRFDPVEFAQRERRFRVVQNVVRARILKERGAAFLKLGHALQLVVQLGSRGGAVARAPVWVSIRALSRVRAHEVVRVDDALLLVAPCQRAHVGTAPQHVAHERGRRNAHAPRLVCAALLNVDCRGVAAQCDARQSAMRIVYVPRFQSACLCIDLCIDLCLRLDCVFA